MMKSIILCIFFVLYIGIDLVHAETSDIGTKASDFAQSLSTARRNTERVEHIEKLMSQYAQVETILLQNLHNACSREIKDKSYFSPLHAAIKAVEIWRIARADDALIEVIDYTLDMASWPVGLTVSGDSFYPAARPLVELRVDIRKVIKAIRQADNEKRIRLLTWVLVERMGSDLSKAAEHLRSEIDKCGDRQSEKDNLTRAIGWLGEARHSDDLLPRDFLHQP